MAEKRDVWIDYINHRGERKWRHVIPKYWCFTSNDWHQTPQWILVAIDLDKEDYREFAVKAIKEWRVEKPDAP